MRKLTAKNIKNQQDRESENGRVHYDGPFLTGWQTLCGHVDRTDFDWFETPAKVNCPGCLAVIKHIKGK